MCLVASFYTSSYLLCLCLPQEKEMEKQKTLYQQARLHDRGAAEMVLQMISASKGNIRLQMLHRESLRYKTGYQHYCTEVPNTRYNTAATLNTRQWRQCDQSQQLNQ